MLVSLTWPSTGTHKLTYTDKLTCLVVSIVDVHKVFHMVKLSSHVTKTRQRIPAITDTSAYLVLPDADVVGCSGC